MAEILGQRPTRDVPDAKAHSLTAAQVAALRESLGKCINPATGEPVSARREETAVLPVKGSVTGAADGNGRGTCPHCGAHVSLSGKGFLTAHNVRKNPVPVAPPAVRLAERQAEVTDTGARVGSPDAAMRTRTAELGAAAGTATVKIKMKVKGEDGREKSQTVEVPATEANIRTAIRQEQAKKQKPIVRKDPNTGKRTPTGVMGGGPDMALLHKLGAMLRGVTGSAALAVPGAQPGTYRVREAVTLDAPNAPEGREERPRDGRDGHVPTSPGPALVQGSAMSCAPPEESARTTSQGKPRNAIGWGAPLGRSRPDRVALKGDPEACRGKGCTIEGCVGVVGGRYGYLECHVFRALSSTRKRRYWQHVATAKSRTEAARVAARKPLVTTHRQWPVTRQTMSGGPAIQQV